MKKLISFFLVIILMVMGQDFTLAASRELITERLSENVDFVISETINMTIDKDSDELVVSPFVIQNNSDNGLKVKSISLTGQSGWSVVSRETADALFGLNNKIFSIFTADGHDLSQPLSDVTTVESKREYVLDLMGKVSLTAKAVTGLHIGDLVVEVEPVSCKTVLYEDGTLIINESEKSAVANKNEHGNVLAEYIPLTTPDSYAFTYSDEVPWANERTSIVRVEFGSPVKPSNMSYWFYGCSNLKSVDSDNLNTSQVTSMNFLFERCGYSADMFSIDLSSWDTSSVKTMYNLFRYSGYNSSKWSVNLTGWNTSFVTNMGGMFEYSGFNSTSWEVFGLENWDTAKVTSFAGMFKNAGKEKVKTFNLDLSKWNTSSAQSMKSMFELAAYNASTWNIGDISNWKTPSLTNMELMFSHAGSSNYRLHNKDLGKWDTSNVKTMKNLFRSSGTYEIKITIPEGCIVDGMLDQKPTVNAVLTFEGLPSSYSNLFRRAATSSTYGKINLISNDAVTKTWFNEMLALYGPSGSTSKGYIYIA